MSNRVIRAIFMVFMISICFSTIFCNAQQLEKEIAKNQASQVQAELEIANSELINSDLDSEQEYLEVQSQAEEAAELSRSQIDSEIAVSGEQFNQDADSQIQAIEQEEQDYMKKAMQESEQQAMEIEAQARSIESDQLITE